MQILSISLKNIKSHRDQELHFVSGINVLSGINGVGKSTIFEAIGYALFGVDARDFVGNIERFITIGAKKGEVEVTFAPGDGDTYRVFRSVGAGSKWLLAREISGRFEVEDHAGMGETESRLKELLGLDNGRPLADQFKLVIGPFQHEFLGPFVLKQPAKRQEAFDEILGIDAWRKTYKGTGTLLKAVTAKIDIMNAAIKGKGEQIMTLPDKRKELTALVSELASQHSFLADKEKILGTTEAKLVNFDGQEQKTQALKANIQILENRIRDGEGKISDSWKRLIEAEQAVEMIKKSRPGKEAFAAAEMRLQSLRIKEKERRTVELAITALDKESARLSQAYRYERQEVEKIDKELTAEELLLITEQKGLVAGADVIATAVPLPELKKEAEALRLAQGLLKGQLAGLQDGKDKLAEGVCPFFKEECRNLADQASSDVFSVRIDTLNKEGLVLAQRLAGTELKIAAAEKARQEVDSLTVRAQELVKRLSALTRRRDEHTKRKQSLGEANKQQEQAEQQCRIRQEDLKKYINLDGDIATIEKLRTAHQAARDTFLAHEKEALDVPARADSLARMQVLLTELRESLAVQARELVTLAQDYDPQRHVEVRVLKEQLVAELATCRQKIADLSKDQLRLGAEIRSMQQIRDEIKDLVVQRKSLADKEELVKFLRNQVFNNVSSRLSERFREEISLRADLIYRTIAETDEELSWNDKYQIVLRDMEHGELRVRSDDQLSGGQTMSAVVALRLALLQTIGARIAFFDEPTSNLDAARRANLAQAFRAIDNGREEITEHWYDQLFLISHDVAFTEITDQIIALE